MRWKEHLNEQQLAAVEATEGPCLVLAGAGTGKTRVITYRVAYLIHERGVAPERILAVTFTNKAADEMAERAVRLLEKIPRRPWVSTFHSLGVRVLRAHIERLGLPSDFVIYDEADQRSLMKETLEALDIGDVDFEPRGALEAVGRAKDKLLAPGDVREQASEPREKLLADLYEGYQERLRAANALDFDDLLFLTVRLLREHKEVLDHYTERFHYVLVDEFQDTNYSQYELMRLLAEGRRNLCAVGDEDQSIYRWRGAEIGNILKFRDEHPDATVVKLERNYRSTDVILQAASAVIAQNSGRIEKTLWSDRPGEHKIVTHAALTDLAEAYIVADEISGLRARYPYAEMAVLYRTNAQSRLIEDALMRRRIPYLVVGGVRFYERKEVKDVLAYLRFLLNPSDEVSLRRILNVPPRGIGARTLIRLQDIAARERLSLWETVRRMLESDEPSPRERNALAAFSELVGRLRDEALPLPELILSVLEATEYYNYLEKEDPRRAEERRENLQGLVSSAKDFVELAPSPEEGREPQEAGLASFLDRVALVSDADQVNPERGVQLMTLHCAKGLEFSVVFVTGLNDGLFPHARSSETPEELEEERRLFYVGMTRAKDVLILTSAEQRRVFGQDTPFDPSPFLEEIPDECFERPAPAASIEPEDQTAGGALFEEKVFSHDAPAPRAHAGMSIYHKHYGRGKILMVESSAHGEKLTIEFQRDRKLKKILARFVELEPS
jgi:DNA helicase-2/ATP-dependent DNA helicase PcrA